jgi:hypothetical protein
MVIQVGAADKSLNAYRTSVGHGENVAINTCAAAMSD